MNTDESETINDADALPRSQRPTRPDTDRPIDHYYGRCAVCDTAFRKYRPHNRYCSDTCRYVAVRYKKKRYKSRRKPAQKRLCDWCGREYSSIYANKIYCSEECQKEHFRETYVKGKDRRPQCGNCGKRFTTRHGTKRYCSEDCYKDAKQKRRYPK